MLEDRVPIAARWSLYALGTVEGQRVKRPRDPVAAWLLRRHPQLLPSFAAPSVLAMIRASTAVVDRMIEDEVARARALGERLAYHGFGCGFDARWYRLTREMRDVVRHHVEIDEPDVMTLKDRLLSVSTFAEAWSDIRREGTAHGDWAVRAPDTERPLVVMDGAPARLGADALEALLGRIRDQAPRAHVIVDLPGFVTPDPVHPEHALGAAAADRLAPELGGRTRWTALRGTAAFALSSARLAALGWTAVEDARFAARPELRAPSGLVMCPGVDAHRALRLHPRP